MVLLDSGISVLVEKLLISLNVELLYTDTPSVPLKTTILLSYSPMALKSFTETLS